MNQLVPIRSADAAPALVAAAGESAKLRFVEFFTANIRNRNTGRAYAQAVAEFLAWCEHHRVSSITAVQPVHVARYIEELTRARSAPTAKQRLSAIRHLFDWLVVGQVMPVNPASSVRGLSHVVKRGKTPVLSPEEARRVLDAIDVSSHAGLRDRALIALMVFSFARVGAALAMKVEDVFVQNRRLWVRLREKGGKRHEMPCHHNLETYLQAYLDGSGDLSADPKGRLFRTIGRTTGQLTNAPLPQANAHAMIRRRALGSAGRGPTVRRVRPDPAHNVGTKVKRDAHALAVALTAPGGDARRGGVDIDFGDEYRLNLVLFALLDEPGRADGDASPEVSNRPGRAKWHSRRHGSAS
jgi:site-specific recombinase XerD